MRKLSLTGFSVFLICVCFSCHGLHAGDSICITISENDDIFKMSSYFKKDKTRKIQRYMNSQLGNESQGFFVNRKMDGMLTMDDQTTFYVKSSPGELEIKLDKDKNSEEGYARVKEMCEGIKHVIEKE